MHMRQVLSPELSILLAQYDDLHCTLLAVQAFPSACHWHCTRWGGPPPPPGGGCGGGRGVGGGGGGGGGGGERAAFVRRCPVVFARLRPRRRVPPRIRLASPTHPVPRRRRPVSHQCERGWVVSPHFNAGRASSTNAGLFHVARHIFTFSPCVDPKTSGGV
jgi:hypothetical protein